MPDEEEDEEAEALACLAGPDDEDDDEEVSLFSFPSKAVKKRQIIEINR